MEDSAVRITYFCTMEEVVLVDENDVEVGLMEKMEAHRKGILHRAFSVFIFNDKNEMLIHQRAAEKYHSPKLWTNACCSHPRKGEPTIEAVKRRLVEELRLECPVKKAFEFIYKAELDSGLTEHELDHVFIGRYNDKVNFNPDEVMDYKYVSILELNKDIEEYPEQYTVWFKIALPEVLKRLNL